MKILFLQKNGDKVIIGRMKGNIHLGDKIYKLSSKKQIEKAKLSYNSENIKIPIGCKIVAKKGANISANAYVCNHMRNSLFNNISVNYESEIIPEKAIKSPTTKERIISQLNKTNDTPFYFEKINIDMEDDIFIPGIKEINKIRRSLLSQIENIIINRIKRNTSNLTDDYINKLLTNEYIDNPISNNIKSNTKHIAIYLNEIHTDFDYTKLSKEYIDKIYIPLRHFNNKNYSNEIKTITENFKTYIYIPAIVKSNYKNIIKHSLDIMINKYHVAGFVISSLGDFVLLDNYKDDYEFIGNFSLNAFNQISINTLANLGLSKITLSPELNLNDITYISNTKKADIPLELIVYGNIPVMKMNYCVLGNSNKCYPECEMRCRTSNKYYLKDRLGFNFRILPDNIQTVTTIFNSKITCITDIKSNINCLRIDCIDESIDEINFIAKSAFFCDRIEGKQYTRGNLYRDV